MSIALQGGGAKGIVYSGVFEGIKKFYGPKPNIKSIIGSSIGAVFSLGIACSLSLEKMISITAKYMGDVMKKDRNFRHDTAEEELLVLNELKEFLLAHGVFS